MSEKSPDSEDIQTAGSDDGQAEQPRGRPAVFLFLPVLIFALLAAGGFYALNLRASGKISEEVPSVLLGKPVPKFELPALAGLQRDNKPVPGFSSDDLKSGQVSLVNVFQSSCVPCRLEHPLLVELAKDKRFSVHGLNYKDDPEDGRKFLGQLGNPYERVGSDRRGRVAIEWGVYGVPETFVVADGRIVAKVIGQITQERLDKILMPAIEKALAENAGKSG